MKRRHRETGACGVRMVIYNLSKYSLASNKLIDVAFLRV